MKRDYDMYIGADDYTEYGLNKILQYVTRIGTSLENLEYQAMYIHEGSEENILEKSKKSIPFVSPMYEDIIFFNIGNNVVMNAIYKKLLESYEGKMFK